MKNFQLTGIDSKWNRVDSNRFTVIDKSVKPDPICYEVKYFQEVGGAMNISTTEENSSYLDNNPISIE